MKLDLHVMLMIAGRPPGAYGRHKEDPWMRCFNVEIDDTVSNCQVKKSELDHGDPGSNEDTADGKGL